MKTFFISLKIAVVALAIMAALTPSFVTPQPVYAAVTCPSGQTAKGNTCTCPGGYQAVSVPVDSSGSYCVAINARTTQLTQNPIFAYLRAFLIFLAGGVGLATVGGIIAGAYMYITARANAAQTEKGKTTILNSVIGLLLFIFMYAILQFLIPGGIFG